MEHEVIDPEYMRVREVAKLCAVHRTTVYQWIKTEKVKAVRLGWAVRIPKAEVLRILGGIENIVPRQWGGPNAA